MLLWEHYAQPREDCSDGLSGAERSGAERNEAERAIRWSAFSVKRIAERARCDERGACEMN